MKIALLGTAPSSRNDAPFRDPSWQIWACSPPNMGLPRVDQWFELHPPEFLGQPPDPPEYPGWLAKLTCPLWMQRRVEAYPASRPYPVQEVVEKWGPYFFTSTLSWMLALAIEEKPEAIGLWGVDMQAESEYGHQRPGCHYFIRRAYEMGIEVSAGVGSEILQPPPLYGFCESKPMWRKLMARKEELAGRIRAADIKQQEAAREMAILTGAKDDVEYMIRTWSGT